MRHRNHIDAFAALRRLGFILLTVTILVGCDKAQERLQVSIAVSRTPLSTPFFVAEAFDLFTKHGVEARLQECIGGHKCLKRLLEGKVDMATAADTPVMFNAFTRDDYAIFGTFVSSTNDVKLMARRSAGVSTVKDLAGKTVGTVTGASAQYFLDTFLLFEGIDPSRVNVVHYAPDKLPDALASKRVDAIAVWEPFGFIATQKLGDDLKIFTNPDIYTETFNLIAMREYAAANADAMTRVLRALKEAIDIIGENPADVQRLVAERLKLDKAFIDWIWTDFRFALTLDQSTLTTLENEARWAVNRGYVTKTDLPNFLVFLRPEFLLDLDRNAVTLIR